MKKISSLFASVICAAAVMAFTASQALAGEGWLTNLEKAQEQAKKEGKLVFLEFTGSDWCGPCIALKKKVLGTEEFAAFAKDNLVLVEIDFPIRKPLDPAQKKYNDDLAKKYKLEGVPMVLVFDGGGKELSKDVGFSGDSVAQYIAKLKKLKK